MLWERWDLWVETAFLGVQAQDRATLWTDHNCHMGEPPATSRVRVVIETRSTGQWTVNSNQMGKQAVPHMEYVVVYSKMFTALVKYSQTKIKESKENHQEVPKTWQPLIAVFKSLVAHAQHICVQIHPFTQSFTGSMRAFGWIGWGKINDSLCIFFQIEIRIWIWIFSIKRIFVTCVCLHISALIIEACLCITRRAEQAMKVFTYSTEFGGWRV